MPTRNGLLVYAKPSLVENCFRNLRSLTMRIDKSDNSPPLISSPIGDSVRSDHEYDGAVIPDATDINLSLCNVLAATKDLRELNISVGGYHLGTTNAQRFGLFLDFETIGHMPLHSLAIDTTAISAEQCFSTAQSARPMRQALGFLALRQLRISCDQLISLLSHSAKSIHTINLHSTDLTSGTWHRVITLMSTHLHKLEYLVFDDCGYNPNCGSKSLAVPRRTSGLAGDTEKSLATSDSQELRALEMLWEQVKQRAQDRRDIEGNS